LQGGGLLFQGALVEGGPLGLQALASLSRLVRSAVSSALTCAMMAFRRASTALPTSEVATARWLEKMQTPAIGAPWVTGGAAAGGAAWAKAPDAVARAARPETVAARNLEVMLIKTLWRWRTGRFRFCRSLL
jgi:hypothetical protein